MTDTGQIPGEGLPENAGMVEQPGVPAPGAYTYLSEATAEDEDLLLLPGAQSAWGNEVAPPAPEPVVETVHQPGPHEMSGRDSGSVDLSGVRLPEPAQDAAAAPAPPRRPLHLGPPIPDTSASPVRSLADRGPADAPVRHPGPPTAGPEYLDVPQAAVATPQAAAPWGAQQAPQAQEAPVNTGAGHAETVVPVPEQQPAEPVGAAQALVTRVATEAVAATGGTRADAGEPGEPQEAPATEPAHTDAGQATGPAEEAVPVPEAAPETVPAEPVAEPVQAAPDATDVPEAPAAQEAQEAPAVQEIQEAAAGQEAPGAPAVQEAPEAPAQPAPEEAAAEAPAEARAEAPAEVPAPAPGEVPAPAPAEAPQALGERSVADAPVADAPAADTPHAAAPQEPAPAEVPEPEPEPELGDAQASDAPVAVAEPDAPAPDAPAPEVAAPEAAAPEPSPAPAPEQPAPVSPEPAQPSQPEAQSAPGDAPQPDVHPAPQPAQGPQSLTDATMQEQEQEVVVADVAAEPEASAPDTSASGATAAQEPVPAPAPVAREPHLAQPVGQFLPVDGGQVPTTPHLAPTPPEAVLVPPEAAPAPVAAAPVAEDAPAAVPAPREADPELAQSVDDLDTRGAGEDDHVAEAAEATAEPTEATAESPESPEAPEEPEEPAEARQPAGPAAPAYDDAEREAVLKVMRERRDIRNGFRSDPIPHEVLLRVLEAAHTAPSVGHSQPWDFVVIRSADTRRAMHELAMRQRDAYAKSLPKGRAKQFKELKIEAILDTPVNIVVTADPTRGGRHTLGRHTQPQMAPYSSALAVENLWLAARAEGLGVGWVSFFDEREMVRALGLPEHLDVVAYLCVGYVDEFPDEPELMQAGWSKRRPLSWVVHEETYGRRALPGEAPHDLLAETVAQIRPLDAKALGEAWERQKRMTKPAGALGMLEIISAQLSGLSRQCPPPIPEPAAVAVFAGDHGVHAQGVTPWPQEVTAQMVANFLGGGAVCNAFATQVGAEVCVVDVGVATDLPATPGLLPRKVRAGTSDMTTGAAMTREEAKQAIEVGIETARDLVAAGNKALLTGEMGIANTTASAALISVFTGADPAEVTGRGTGINDETLARKTEVVRRALELHQPDPADPIGVLAAIGGFEHAAMVGLLLGGASLRTPVILDGVSAGAAALVARAIAPEVLAACIAGHRSAEPGHVAALNKLGLRPLVDLDLRLGEGTGALLALPMVQSTARAMHEVATFDSAGVTEK
ncbi:nicotinate-nucleotide--dimethylbenzimidazole phosphoribosyltransferase [Streptomyces sp. KPB2]|uniref:nicotinate-nucleotide--dimethylbenzimidazole phosphoribosyltransferase n=1 Tax=unclassified Streptomyces TaxID=2593676 RepID=UPI000F6D2842|nr:MULTISPECIES: nicotinate-nucleotide--dimethylbenzimidazole phosphoribosyltransferase [unclassified Streptomyces]AZM78701.1 nicotinate-nucleotide--dimethylbenzimidazole phosphoribosyltransferase [Streptomyces sp. KPB2]QKW64307.1 nicotinate-nucleotide--dimethylbenzimidazole phosphoribosyltransferase [Streptomyces sp. NA03103]